MKRITSIARLFLIAFLMCAALPSRSVVLAQMGASADVPGKVRDARVNFQPVAQTDAQIDAGKLPTWAEVKAKEPRLLSDAEQAKLWPLLADSKAAYDAFLKRPEDVKASAQAWETEHTRKFNAIKPISSVKEAASIEQTDLGTSSSAGGVPPAPTPAPQSKAGAKALYKPAVFQGSPRNINVIVINYTTVTTGVAQLPYVTQDLVNGLNAGSKFQGSGTQALNYNRIATYTVSGAAPTLNFPQPGVSNTGLYTNFMDIASIYSTYNLCSQFAAGTVDQVWIFSDGFSAPNQIEFAVNGSDWRIYETYTNVPKCGKAGVFFSFVYANKISGNWYPVFSHNAIHSYGHYVEQTLTARQQWDYAICDYEDGAGRFPSDYTGSTYWASAYCPSRPMSWTRGFMAHANASNSNVAVCGDVHYPPNVSGTLTTTNEYVYTSTTSVNSICGNWLWTGSPSATGVACATWSQNCSDASASQYWYLVWWMQHIPSATTNATDRWGVTRGNHWNNVPSRIPVADVIARGDFDGDAKADYALYRPSTGVYWIKTGSGSWSTIACPASSTVPRTGRTATLPYYLVYQVSTGDYYISDAAGPCTKFLTIPTGLQVGSAKFSYITQTVQSDAWRWDGATGQFTVSYASGASGPISTSFTLGGSGFVVAIADYDGDGVQDPGVYNHTSGEWRYIQSSNLATITTTWKAGCSGCFAVPADYDGDKKAEIAAYNYNDGGWYIQKMSVSGQTNVVTNFGDPAYSDIPVPADFDGDRYTNLAVFRASLNQWYYLNRDGSVVGTTWGGTGDQPVTQMPW